MPNGVPVNGLPQGVINVIHRIIEPERVCKLRGMINKGGAHEGVLSVQPTLKKERTKAKNVISFSDRDLARLQNPHNDALVVTLCVKNFYIKRILIGEGSSYEIRYHETFKQLQSNDRDLAPNTSPEWPVGKIILPIKASLIVKRVEFWVLKVSST
ncbi:uncharacterized protein LOC114313763 [Camellia sinensis]|uniref:uncharacterized protein LOC114313763 n=1 Tax=Camellia sinensis TaxID=4442 RepID=UPI0010363EF9|nr:uncharacterized protein LOC114313763 [Camellia sinensis]